MKFLVTVATGFIGFHLVKRLIKESIRTSPHPTKKAQREDEINTLTHGNEG
jgi:nucleoside-diphosphate-sugar epimerase